MIKKIKNIQQLKKFLNDKYELLYIGVINEYGFFTNNAKKIKILICDVKINYVIIYKNDIIYTLIPLDNYELINHTLSFLIAKYGYKDAYFINNMKGVNYE